MTMKGPVTGRIGCEHEAHPLRGLDVDRVLERQVIALAVLELEQVAVQMDRMLHHRVVDQHETDALAELHADGPGLREFLAVEAPDEAFHVPRQMELQSARGRRSQRRRTKRTEISIGEV